MVSPARVHQEDGRGVARFNSKPRSKILKNEPGALWAQVFIDFERGMATHRGRGCMCES